MRNLLAEPIRQEEVKKALCAAPRRRRYALRNCDKPRREKQKRTLLFSPFRRAAAGAREATLQADAQVLFVGAPVVLLEIDAEDAQDEVGELGDVNSSAQGNSQVSQEGVTDGGFHANVLPVLPATGEMEPVPAAMAILVNQVFGRPVCPA